MVFAILFIKPRPVVAEKYYNLVWFSFERDQRLRLYGLIDHYYFAGHPGAVTLSNITVVVTFVSREQAAKPTKMLLLSGTVGVCIFVHIQFLPSIEIDAK
jgi:hypothetical protein